MSPERYPYNVHTDLEPLSRHQQMIKRYGVWRCNYCGKKKPSGVEPSEFSCCGEVGHCTVELED